MWASLDQFQRHLESDHNSGYHTWEGAESTAPVVHSGIVDC